MNTLKYTKLQQKVLELLWDGKGHSIADLKRIMGYDPEDGINAMRVNLHLLNKALESNGEGLKIVCVTRGKYVQYQLFRKLHTNE